MAQDRPTAAELLEAVREFLEAEVTPGLAGHTGFHARVALNVIAMVERELTLGPDLDRAEAERLRALLDAEGDLAQLNAELARRLRAGELDHRREEVVAHLRISARAKLAIANPRYLEREDRLI